MLKVPMKGAGAPNTTALKVKPTEGVLPSVFWRVWSRFKEMKGSPVLVTRDAKRAVSFRYLTTAERGALIDTVSEY